MRWVEHRSPRCKLGIIAVIRHPLVKVRGFEPLVSRTQTVRDGLLHYTLLVDYQRVELRQATYQIAQVYRTVIVIGGCSGT